MAKRYKFFLFAIAACYLWFICAATHPSLPTPDAPLLFYSNQSRSDFRHTLLRAFENGSSIHLTIYALTDPKVLTLLHKKANQGADVRISFDPSATPALFHPPIVATPLKGKGLMHRKIAIVDNALVFLGSANFTTSSLSLHNNLSVGLYHPDLAEFLLAPSTPYFDFAVGGQSARLTLLPEGGSAALADLCSHLDNANRSIRVAMFTLTHPDLVACLIAAHERGVDVAVALDYYSGRGASKKAAAQLQQSGVKIYLSQGNELLHHKWVWIDDHALILGSTNWTRAAFTRNRDLLLFLSDLTLAQNRYLAHLWSALMDECNSLGK